MSGVPLKWLSCTRLGYAARLDGPPLAVEAFMHDKIRGNVTIGTADLDLRMLPANARGLAALLIAAADEAERLESLSPPVKP